MGISHEEADHEMLGIGCKGNITQLGFILSDQYDVPMMIAAFLDDDRATFKDRTILTGSVLKQMEDAMGFIMKYNRLGSKFVGLRRKDTYAYPVDAVREALVNAVVYRDYSMDASILISIHPDRIEISSPEDYTFPTVSRNWDLGSPPCATRTLRP